MITERTDRALSREEPPAHPELVRAHTFITSLKQEWQPLFGEPLAQAVASFARLHQEEVTLEARGRENDQLLQQAVTHVESAQAAAGTLQHEIATGASPEYIRERIRQILASPHAKDRIVVRILKRLVGERPQSISKRLEEARAAVAEASKIREEARRKHEAEKEEITKLQEQQARRPANIAIQLHTRMELIAAHDQELVYSYMRAYPENATRVVHTFAEVHASDSTIIEQYFPDFCLEALHQKQATKRAQAQPLYQRLERRQPEEPLSISLLTRAELTYWTTYISYRILKECWEEESSPLRTVMTEPTVPRLV